MAKRIKVTFKRVNGDNTGYYTRRGMSSKYPTDGIHYMRNCSDGKTFYCDPADGGVNGYYKLIDPEKNGINTNGNSCYAWLNNSFCSWIEEEYEEPKPPVINPPASVALPEVPTQRTYEPKPQARSGFTNLFGDRTADTNVWHSGDAVYTSAKLKPNQVRAYQYINQPYNDTNDNLPSLTSINRTSFYNDYEDLLENMSIIRKNLNINDSASNLADLRYNMVNRFDRWKVAHPDIQLSKSFAYVFFTRPDLNIYENLSFTELKLVDKVDRDPTFYYLDNNNRQLLRCLTKSFSGKHDFNPFLSNMAASFELSDEMIDTIEQGETFTGYKVMYGRHNIKSRTAGSFNVSYVDDDEYKVYKIHRAWVDYISKVYRGEFEANKNYIRERILDYACSAYYFLCGADGETILFWSKYTGVFPTAIPSATSSWTKGSTLKMPEISVPYAYSWKEDFNPISLAEFNKNGLGAEQSGTYDYISTYEPELLTTGRTFTGSPFVETSKNNVGEYTFKLRFRVPGENN